MLECMALKGFVLRETGAKEVVVRLIHGVVPPVDVFIVADSFEFVQ